MKEVNEHTIQWLAGYLEGEGSFVCKSSGVAIVAGSTDLDVLESIQKIFGGSIYKIKTRQSHWKQAWRWQITGLQACDLAVELKDFMHLRRKIAIEKLIGQYENSPKYIKKLEVERRTKSMLELRDNGLKHREIADKLHVERSIVSHTLRKYGVGGEKESRQPVTLELRYRNSSDTPNNMST